LKIEQLLEREPFGKILQVTLSRFFSEYYGRPYQVVWKKLALYERFVKVVHSDGERFYCNPFLNIIFAQDADQSVFDFLTVNYRHTPHKYRRQLQKIYVSLVANHYTAKLCTTYCLDIKPRLPGSSNIVILGGNNRIRLIDLQNKRSWDILKDSFDVEYMISELSARKRDGSWPFPRLGTIAHDNTWFEAEYVDAVSLNRLTEEESSPKLMKQALEFLDVWLENTVTPCSVESYFQSLVARIKINSDAALFCKQDREMIGEWLLSAQNILGRLMADSGKLFVDLADGHGDFQYGNILACHNSQVWIVDWEHAGKRQYAYDYLVFSLYSRFPSGLSERILFSLRDGDYVSQRLPGLSTRMDRLLADNKKRRLMLLLFILEELLWSTRENSNPCFLQQSGAWLQLKQEIGRSLHYINDSWTEQRVSIQNPG